MQQFGDGGLNDEGGTIDEVSGNEVPVGGTKEGVRDDIPANVSEGEFIFPEDVVRFIGLDKLMSIRQDAKMGLKKMDAMGQMGNGDEASMPDDMPFDMTDIIVVGDNEQPMEFAGGGFIPVEDYTVVQDMIEDRSDKAAAIDKDKAMSDMIADNTTKSAVIDKENEIQNFAPGGSVGSMAGRMMGFGAASNMDTSAAEKAPANTTFDNPTTGQERFDDTGDGPQASSSATTGRKKLTFKEMMGDQYAEILVYSNEAGDKIVVPAINGVPIYTPPPGYTLYVPPAEGEEEVGEPLPPAAAGAIQNINSNNDRRLDVNGNRKEPPQAEVPEPIDWAGMSSKDFIEEFEERLGKQISTRDADGNVTGLDFDLARKVGKETTESLYGSKTRAFLDNVVGVKTIADVDVAKGVDETFSVILNPDKLDAIVAVASDLKKQFPDAFKPKINPVTNKKLRVIDHLFELTVSGELKSDKLIDTLGTYGLTYEDYVVSVVGSGSDAGRLLQKLSQLGRARPKSEAEEIANRSLMDAQNGIRQWVMRIENIRRGSLVSQLATAARNVTSVAIRMPLESLGNVMDTALYSLGKEGWGAAGKSMLNRQNWVGSFKGMGHFSSLNTGGLYRKNREFTDMILEQPEFSTQYDKMFNQLNEIRKHTQGPTGGVLDKVATQLERGVDVLNTPNRLQEFMVRRVSFLSELERLVKREWNVDLIDTVGNGDLRKLTSDMSQFKPKGARSFIELVDSSVGKALDVTYAKQPDLKIFRDATNFITRNGLTTIIPFPRFMFNSIELVATYAGGASIPLTRKLLDMGKKTKGGALSEVERKLVTRNVMGLAGIIAAYQYRSEIGSMELGEKLQEQVEGDYKLLAFGDKRVDVTPQFPMRQYMWAGEAVRRIANGTFSDWYDHREAMQTFMGTNVRVGTGNVIFNDLAEIISSDDAVAGERVKTGFAKAVGNYLSTFATPIAQIVEAQRAAGMRTMDYVDAANDPTLNTSDNFLSEFSRPFRARGFSNLFTPDSEGTLPPRDFLFSQDKQRPNPLVKGIFGINMFEKDEDYGQFFKQLGYTEWKLGSRSRIPTQKRNENQIIRAILPAVANLGRALQAEYESEYDILLSRGQETGGLSKEKWVSSKLKVTLDKQLTRAKSLAGQVGEKDVSRESLAHDSWRKIPKNARSSAMTRFLEIKNRDPELADLKDMELLIGIAKAVR